MRSVFEYWGLDKVAQLAFVRGLESPLSSGIESVANGEPIIGLSWQESWGFTSLVAGAPGTSKVKIGKRVLWPSTGQTWRGMIPETSRGRNQLLILDH